MSKHNEQAPAVCFVTPEYTPRATGIARSAVRIVRHLLEGGFEMHVFVPQRGESGETTATTHAIEDGVHVHRVRLEQDASKLMLAYVLSEEIRKVDEVSRFALFHGFFLPVAFSCLRVAEHGSRPVIASIRGSDAVDWLVTENQRNIISIVLQKASWVTSVSTDLLDNVCALRDVSEKSSVILNSIDSSDFPTWQLTDENRGVVGTLGEFRYKKDIPLLVQSYAALNPELRRKLLLVGYYDKETTRSDCERAIAQYNVEGETHFTGLVRDDAIKEHLMGMRVFVVCSKHDGLPNALLEAAAVGVPLVATAVGGMLDVLVDGENALLVPPEDPIRLTEAIEAVLRDEALARRLSGAAREIVSNLQPEKEKRAWIELYQRMLDHA
jgi:glycosyltransferase involved in cell wall biosynthesis